LTEEILGCNSESLQPNCSIMKTLFIVALVSVVLMFDSSSAEPLKEKTISTGETGYSRETLENLEKLSFADFMMAKKKDFKGCDESANEMRLCLKLLNDKVKIYQNLKSVKLTKSDSARLKQYKSKIIKSQVMGFPIIRDQLGPALRKMLWDFDGTASTNGNSFTNLTIIAPDFAANRNVKQFHESIMPSLEQARIKKVIYKWFKYDEEPNTFKLKPLKDSDLATFDQYGRYVKVD